ncbi:Translation initiation factor [Quillaja saponaria]|uniref:Translation initiation factor n=1 Tax=Quillaja saponaria TaxID=32244 RepID=A0AAD7LFF8_QUISA|nr:Translation initiation factor [Quillaja saponaria]
MPRGRARRTVKKTAPSAGINENDAENAKEPQIEEEEAKQEAQFIDQEVERQVAAIRAIRDLEIEHLLTKLRLLRSYLNKEQLQTPVLQFFEQSLPNLSVVSDTENKQFEVQWSDKDGGLSMNYAGGESIHTSLLHRLSLAYPNCSTAIPPLSSFQFSSKAVKTSFLGADNLHIKDFVFEEPSDTQTLQMQEALQTPGVSSQRLSIGMTPKTLRQPKRGEMLLSVHGSPLGVYKEDNMEAICESEEG